MFKKRILIVEDDAEIRASFEIIINGSKNYYVVGTYGNCEEAIKSLAKTQPDIVLMDIQLPGMNGIEGTREIIKRNRFVSVIILSVHEDSKLVFEALKAGASGYITKSADYIELIKGLEEISHGGAPMSSNIARMVIQSFHKNHNSPLSARETEVLQYFAEGKSYTQIAEEMILSKETIKTHIRNIYVKLNASSKSEAIDIAKKNKYIS